MRATLPLSFFGHFAPRDGMLAGDSSITGSSVAAAQSTDNTRSKHLKKLGAQRLPVELHTETQARRASLLGQGQMRHAAHLAQQAQRPKRAHEDQVVHAAGLSPAPPPPELAPVLQHAHDAQQRALRDVTTAAGHWAHAACKIAHGRGMDAVSVGTRDYAHSMLANGRSNDMAILCHF